MPIPGIPSLSLTGFILLVAAGYWATVVYRDAFVRLPWDPQVGNRLTDWE